MEEMESSELKGDEEDIFLLKGEDSVQIKTDNDLKKGLSSHLAELDFYISEGYFANAEKILDRLQKEFPESREIVSRLGRIKKSKESQPDKTDSIKPKTGKTEPIEITSSISQESDILQKFEDSKIDIALDNVLIKPDKKDTAVDFSEIDSVPFEIEMEKVIKNDTDPLIAKDKIEIFQEPARREKSGTVDKSFLGSSADFFDIDNIFTSEEGQSQSESPFKDIDENELAENEVDIFKSENVFLEEEEYYETEKAVSGELDAIKYWIDELQKQRTSTVEKNMMEIFQAFQKGVDEKIGQEDYDTRYNLGIAYKEMGLIEEAIHEFLIAAKHPLKFFDAAGLLGICFRDQGMFEESINWFEKALESQDRKEDDYKAVKYELILTAKLKEDYLYAKKLAAEILSKDPNYRNIKEIYDEVKGK
jgi:tetratricopeptide (TPR) repeat protein